MGLPIVEGKTSVNLRAPVDPQMSVAMAASRGKYNEGYMPGFGNDFETEALEGALPVGQNSPQRCPYGLYAEQLSGSPFTAPRSANERSWLYRMRPSVQHTNQFVRTDYSLWRSAPDRARSPPPLGPLRWDPTPISNTVDLDFVSGLRTITTAGDVCAQTGFAAHIYVVTRSMADDYFYNADGELLIVPETGRLRFLTEMGVIDIGPAEITVIPRGVKFKVLVLDGPARGYICENYGAKLTCPERGPIGANCLANRRDFLTPVAAYEDRDGVACRIIVKWCGEFHAAQLDHSPLDVVAWHGNYAPYKYDLRRFSPVGPVLKDHADPSIFTVLTSPSETQGTANVDFVVFPPRWLVAEDSFRPPWYHLNIMSEFMGLIEGIYDAKPEGFLPGGMSLHNCMLPHGPDADAFYRASVARLEPEKLANTLAFMLEARFPQHVTTYAAELPTLQASYTNVWKGLRRHFDPARRVWNGD